MRQFISAAALSDFASHPHGVTLAITTAPLMSWAMGLQPILSLVLTLCGIGWYALLFYRAGRDRHK